MPTARHASFLAVLLLSLGLAPAEAADKPAGALDLEIEDVRPGLLASYRSLVDKDASLQRVEAKPAFCLGHSSPHPRLPVGPFEVVWTGVLFLKEPGPVTFDAHVGGEVTMEVDGVTVLQGRGASDTSHIGAKDALNRPLGFYRVTVRYRALAEVPARLQIGWQGPSFSREPLPTWQLKHLPAELSPAARQEELAAQGRAAVGRLGCARCHAGAFPGVTDPPPGPALADVQHRISKTWLMDWLADPAKVRPGAHMPALFPADRQGWVERWIIAEQLGGPAKAVGTDVPGDHRNGRRMFLTLGCAACHLVPDIERKDQPDLRRVPLTGLGDRFHPDDLAAFLGNPHGRYPDGRMPRLPVAPDTARNIAAYLLFWSKPGPEPAAAAPPAPDEIAAAAQRLGVRGQAAAAVALLRSKGCLSCHPGLGEGIPNSVPITVAVEKRGCLTTEGSVRYTANAATRKAIAAYQAVAAREKHPSPFESRRLLIERVGCLRCHQRDSDRPPPIEEAGSTLGGSLLEYLPFQRTPRLTYVHQKYTRAHLVTTVREGIAGLRSAHYSYRMPAFGTEAEAIVQALAEADGELPAAADPVPPPVADPTVGTLMGPNLIGFQGYACVSCHVWNGQMLSESDPGAIGPDLTRVAGRIRRDWFDRFLEDPARAHPGTPMPSIMPHGKPAMLRTILDGDPVRQKDALWSYFALGKEAPSPKPPPPLPVTAPAAGEVPLIAQIPIRLSKGGTVESISVLFGSQDLLIYDLATAAPHSFYTGAQILRNVQGRLRSYSAAGTPAGAGFLAEPPVQLIRGDKPEAPSGLILHGYDRLDDGVRIRWRVEFGSVVIEMAEGLRLTGEGAARRLVRELRLTGVPEKMTVQVRSRVLDALGAQATASAGSVQSVVADKLITVRLTADDQHSVSAVIRYALPPPLPAPSWEGKLLADPGKIEGSLERPGYRAIAYPRPKTVSGEDRVMPGAVAVHPRDGRVFVASLKTGELFVLRDPHGDGKDAHFDSYGHGLFQEALSMLAEEDGLYVLHRRNLTKIVETKRDGVPDRFERVVALPHGVADTYDYGYGLVRDKTGAFVFTYAPYANTSLPGSGSAIRVVPGKPPQEVAFGFRNPLGWCTGPEGEIFYTDNQGEWVATNKLCHVVAGRFYGYPNQAQKQHVSKPKGKTTVWVPYGWARSINGVSYDNTGGKFGPFAGQFFMAELMYGGAIIRANVEKVNGEYQGACFPFWDKGLLGPLTLAFDPKGRLFVGGITEPGWMAQPDRGALFRIDYTGQVPFEMQSIHVTPDGFRVVFTAPVNAETARAAAAYQIEHYRYEYTGAYGSPELDRTRVAIERVDVAADGRSVELKLPFVRDRVYLISARGVLSAKGEAPVHPTGAYTLNEIPVRQ